MTWAVTPGGPHGGPSPVPQVDDIVSHRLYPGDTLVLTGTGFTPGTQVVLNPGGKVIGVSSPLSTTSITLTLPFGLPNVKHQVTVSNGNQSNSVELFVLRDVTLAAAPNTIANVTLVEAN